MGLVSCVPLTINNISVDQEDRFPGEGKGRLGRVWSRI